MGFRIGTVGMVSAAMVSVLTCYTLSLRVSAERSRVEDLRGDIAREMKDVRALEAELKTRARLPQLQRWNDNVLAMSAPVATQFVDGPVQLVSLAPGAAPAVESAPVPAVVRTVAPPPAPLVHTANYAPKPAAEEESAITVALSKKAEPTKKVAVAAAAPKAPVAKAPSLDSLLDDLDRAADAERGGNLVKVSLR